MKRVLTLALIVLLSSCKGVVREGHLIEDLLSQQPEKYGEYLKNPAKYRMQIVYTQVNRDADNKPHLKTYQYRADVGEYFYPASAVKLPVAALALEKIDDLLIPNLTRYTTMLTDSAYSGQTAAYEDTSSFNGKPSVAQYIRKMFLVSDNNSFNRLYEFVGHAEINSRLYKKGYKKLRIVHRLSVPLSYQENHYTNPVRFIYQGKVLYEQPLRYDTLDIRSKQPIYLGTGYMKDDSLVNEPMDFSAKNYIPLMSLQKMLQTIIFPEDFLPTERFQLRDDDYKFLRRHLSMYPRESDFPYYGGRIEDAYGKFFMFGGTKDNIDRNIRIFNKIGGAYGFLIDNAYIVDFKHHIEFFLSAVIYVNDNNILNDGIYAYDEKGFPFLHDLGWTFYNYEMRRDKKFIPDLTKFRPENLNQ